MANSIVFDYAQMQDAIRALDQLAVQYEEAAKTFLSNMNNATATWSGASKNKFMELVQVSVYKYMAEGVPQTVRGMGQVLKHNIEAMSNADQEIASKIPPTI